MGRRSSGESDEAATVSSVNPEDHRELSSDTALPAVSCRGRRSSRF